MTRHRADGTRDPGFVMNYGTLAPLTIRSVIVRPNGRLLIAGTTALDRANYHALSFNADGSVDTTFAPDPEFAANANRAVLLDDGRWLVITTSQLFINTTLAAKRFLPNGFADANYSPRPLVLVPYSANDGDLFSTYAALVYARDAAGKIYAAVRYGDTSFSLEARSGKSRLFRFNADGTLDTTFSPVDYDPIDVMRVTEHGIMIRTRTYSWHRLGTANTTTQVLRLRFDGTIDPAYQPINASMVQSGVGPVNTLADALVPIVLQADGSVVAVAEGAMARFGLIRFNPDGTRDRDFAAELGFNATAITQIAPSTAGAFLVAGDFTALGGVAARYVAKITPNDHATTTRFVNLSARAPVGGDNGPLTLGFVTRGASTSVLARGSGPALQPYHVSGWLADPELTLFNRNTPAGSNDNWGDTNSDALSATATALNAFPFDAGSKDAALLATVESGNHSVQVRAHDGGTGVALAELYDASTAGSGARLVNLSVLSHAGTADARLSAGFSITGDTARTVVIRAIGPTLDTFGVVTPLPDPQLSLYRGTTLIAANNDWSFGSVLNVDLYARAAFDAVGAFPLPLSNTYPVVGSKDAAIVVTLAPGTYSVVVEDRNGSTGNALIEVYEVE